jgi:hypothetical protein
MLAVIDQGNDAPSPLDTPLAAFRSTAHGITDFQAFEDG